jgi:diguanylate cyclase (GGDEF)-like protein
MKQTHALVFALAQRYLKEFIPGEWRAELEDDFAEAARVVAEEAPLQDWIDHKMVWFETWQGLLETPKFKGGVLQGITTALFKGQSLKIQYRRDRETKIYTVHPLGLVKRDHVVYLVATAWNYENPLFLSLHRMDWAFPQEAPANKPADFNLHTFLEHGWPAQFESSQPRTLKVELLFREDVYSSVCEKPLKGADIHEPEDGWFKVKGEVSNSMELRWWLLGFNEKVRILAPQELADQLQNLLFDPLTGLLLRRALEEHLDRLLAAGQRRGAPLALVMLDVDHFKSVNDQHGHAVGDTVLKEVAQRLKSGCRAMDFVGRWGGEEFMILLPDVDEKAALDIAERFRSEIASPSISIDDQGTPLPITISIGVCWISFRDGTPAVPKETLLAQVDVALYKAKGDGRNRVCLWDKDTPKNSIK